MADTVKIGSRTYTIRVKDRLASGALGWCYFPAAHKSARGRIEIKRVQDDAADTVLHEILHAICDARKLNLEYDEEERIVTSLTTGLTKFLRDNPEYREKWLRML